MNRRLFTFLTAALLCCAPLAAQFMPGMPDAAGGAQANAGDPTLAERLVELGWSMLRVLGAIASGAFLAYHPRSRSRVADLADIELPKIYITYSMVGALCALIVQINYMMGFAIFGVGALMRVRTILSSAKDTGRLILATVIGFCWGVDLFETAVAVSLLAWILIWILDSKVGFRMLVKGLDKKMLPNCEAAYRKVLEAYGCRVSQVKKHLNKGQLSVVFLANRKVDRDTLEEAFQDEVDETLRGTIDWPEEG